MDTDLAFCLGRFIDDQVQLIDKQLDDIQTEEDDKCRELEKQKVEANKKKPPPKNKGSHFEDQTLVDQFIRELRDSIKPENNTKTIIDDKTCLDALRAEISTKLNASTNYITRIRNTARSLPKTTDFVQTCDDFINYARQRQEFDNHFERLCAILKQTDSENVLQCIQQWWKDSYGSKIIEINNRNDKFNKPLTDRGFGTISQTSPIADNAKKLVAARKIIIVEPPKRDIIRRFVRRLLSADEEQRTTTDPDELVEQLNNLAIEDAINYAQKWLKKRDDIRNQKEERDPYDVKIEEVKDEYGRRKLAQEAKKIALAALLCRLAVGSTNGDQFDQQLKRTIDNQKNRNKDSFAVISGDIKEPEIEELPVIIRLNNTDMNGWINNYNGIQEQFGIALCQAFLIPENNIRIDNIEGDDGVMYIRVLPPHGKVVIDSLNGTAPDAVPRMEAVRKCCRDLQMNVESITLGEFGLKIEDKLMDPRWNKVYVWPDSPKGEGDYWATPIMRGDKPYYCPSGWKRFGIKVAQDEKDFDARWGNWYIAYHGTAGENASKILTSGLKVSTDGCFYNDGEPRVYVSPSIEYCGHPRYARPWKQTKKNGQILWYQLVFQCRVNPASVDKVRPETLIPKEHKTTIQVDANFQNTELEWIILGKEGQQFIKNDIICYGLMMRVSNVDPKTLTPCNWWKYSLHSDIY